ncbi:ABC transporter substrate-binding protein [Pectobacterium sp. B1J-3]|uniref:ABC transporter substrate-binding protein n=1 Tax=Pectobacterium sp. B1J-3 TaxID=3385371 RepID=UPI003905AC25
MNIKRRTFIGGMAALATSTLLPLGAIFPGSAWAAQRDGTLTLAFSTEPSSLDPHWHTVSANASLSTHLFDRLVYPDAQQNPQPGLATAWRAIDDLTWEFDLRPDVHFHNGDLFTADDVLFTYERAQNVPGAPFSMRAYLGDKTVEKINDRQIRIRTKAPNPIVPNELSTVSIISHRVGNGATSADYNSGKAVVGTGPYRLVESIPGNRVVLERNEQYWGAKPAWRRVIIRPIPAAGARVAALLSGDVDVIDNVPPTDLARLSKTAGIALTRSVTNRAIFLSLDQSRAVSPFIRAKDGSEIPNPFLDRRVRQAFSLAIDKAAIATRILEDNGQPATQLVPPGIFGHSPNLPLRLADVAQAKQLLSDAGFQNGFQITLHAPNDRFIRDAAVVQAVAQMLTRIGISVQVDAMPSSIFYKRVSGGSEGSEFSFFLVGFGGGTGEASPALKSVLHSYDKTRGFGATNRVRYSNKQVDELLEQGLVTLDDTKRQALFAQATDLAIDDVAIIPLYYPINVWALRQPVTYPGRTDERTLATEMTI